MTALAPYGWWLDFHIGNDIAFSNQPDSNAVNLNSFHSLSGAAGAPGALSAFTVAAWFYYDGVEFQSIGFGSDFALGAAGVPYFSIQLSADPQVVGVNWQASAGGNGALAPFWSTRTLPAGADWVLVILSVDITNTSPAAATCSMALCQLSLGRAGDQSMVVSMPSAEPFETITFDSIPDFSATNPDWVLGNDVGFNDAVGGVDWITVVPGYYDLTVQANRELFSVEAGGELGPVDPTSLSPIILFRGDTTEFATNQVDAAVWTETDGGGPLVNFPAPASFIP